MAQSLGTELLSARKPESWNLKWNLSMVLFCSEEYLLDTNFELKSRKLADFMKIVLAVSRLVRYSEK